MQPALRCRGKEGSLLTKEIVFHPVLNLSQSVRFSELESEVGLANYDSHLL